MLFYTKPLVWLGKDTVWEKEAVQIYWNQKTQKDLAPGREAKVE